MMIMDYVPSVADMAAMRDGELLIELPEMYHLYVARMSAGVTWKELTEACPLWEKGGEWWRERGTGNVLSAMELRATCKWLYPALTDELVEKYLNEKED